MRVDGTDDQSSPQQMPGLQQDRNAFSKVHAALDAVLSFLQGELGYTLLDDAQPQSGGGVLLDQSQKEESGLVGGESGTRDLQEDAGGSHGDRPGHHHHVAVSKADSDIRSSALSTTLSQMDDDEEVDDASDQTNM